MSEFIGLPLLMRWIHIYAAIVLIGGTIFIFAVLRPVSAKGITPEERAKLRTSLMKRWKFFAHLSIVLLLITGFYNLVIAIRANSESDVLYISLFCAKFALALAVFALVFIGTSTMKWSESLRDRKGLWALLVAASIAVVLVANIMKFVSHQAP